MRRPVLLHMRSSVVAVRWQQVCKPWFLAALVLGTCRLSSILLPLETQWRFLYRAVYVLV